MTNDVVAKKMKLKEDKKKLNKDIEEDLIAKKSMSSYGEGINITWENY